MTLIKEILGCYKSVYKAAKVLETRASQLSRLSKAEAKADSTGQVWIKSKTKINLENHNE